jgi:ABC-2 type transport system permease protein
MVMIWGSIFADAANTRGYTLQLIIQYYLVMMIIDGVISSHFENWRVEEVRNGKIDYYLTRPIPYLLEILLRDIGGKLGYLTFAMPFFLLLFGVVAWLYELPALTANPVAWISFLVLVLGAYLVEFLLALTIVLLGFWFEGAEGLEHFKWIIISLFSGSMLPIVFMPGWMQEVVGWLPFQLMYAKPIGILQNTSWLTGVELSLLGGCIALQLLLNLWLWQKARYRYASAGG